ncbi:hypothetical protein H9P43_002089 [Blastocladiella emersonii ATCC 22665]|nr:hypothetical protein H9P43_002089 [Blastocladiella emersonii ATCC 22665]
MNGTKTTSNRPSAASAAAAANGTNGSRVPHPSVLHSVPINDDALSAHRVSVSVIRDAASSAAALQFLTEPHAHVACAGSPSSVPVLTKAGMLALDLEGVLTPGVSAALADPTAVPAPVNIHSIQIGVPLAPLHVAPLHHELYLPESLARESHPTQVVPSVTPTHVFYWVLEDMADDAIRAEAMEHVAAILAFPHKVTVLHAGAGDAYALFQQYGVRLCAPLVNTQIVYARWTALTARVRDLRAAVVGELGVADVPPLNARFLAIDAPDTAAATSESVIPKTDLGAPPGEIFDPAWDVMGRLGSGLNDVLRACGLPENALKNKTRGSAIAQTRYAVTDVAFLCQAYAHMMRAIAYLAHHLTALESYANVLPMMSADANAAAAAIARADASTAYGATGLSSSVPQDDAASGAMQHEDANMVWELAGLIASSGTPALDPRAAGATRPAVDVVWFNELVGKRITKRARTRYSQRGGGAVRLCADFPAYFTLLAPSYFDTAKTVRIALVQMPPEPMLVKLATTAAASALVSANMASDIATAQSKRAAKRAERAEREAAAKAGANGAEATPATAEPAPAAPVAAAAKAGSGGMASSAKWDDLPAPPAPDQTVDEEAAAAAAFTAKRLSTLSALLQDAEHIREDLDPRHYSRRSTTGYHPLHSPSLPASPSPAPFASTSPLFAPASLSPSPPAPVITLSAAMTAAATKPPTGAGGKPRRRACGLARWLLVLAVLVVLGAGSYVVLVYTRVVGKPGWLEFLPVSASSAAAASPGQPTSGGSSPTAGTSPSDAATPSVGAAAAGNVTGGMLGRRVAPVNGSILFGAHIWGDGATWRPESPADWNKRMDFQGAGFGSFVHIDAADGVKDRAGVLAQADAVRAARGFFLITLEPMDGLAAMTPAVIDKVVAVLKTINDRGVPVLLRFAHEMNGNWYRWGQRPLAYKKTWVDLARAVRAGAPLTSLVFSPNSPNGYPWAGSGASQQLPAKSDPEFAALDTNGDGEIGAGDDPFAPYYPGSEWVDWIGMSQFDFGPYPFGTNTMADPAAVAGLTNLIAPFAAREGKPLGIFEAASAFYTNPVTAKGTASEAAMKAAWLAQLVAPASRTRGVALVMWFDFAKREDGNLDRDFAITKSDAVADAAKAVLRDRTRSAAAGASAS